MLPPIPMQSSGRGLDESCGGESLESYSESDVVKTDNVAICVEDIKLQMLAKSCTVPGLPNLLFFLVKSSGDAVSALPCACSLTPFVLPRQSSGFCGRSLFACLFACL